MAFPLTPECPSWGPQIRGNASPSYRAYRASCWGFTVLGILGLWHLKCITHLTSVPYPWFFVFACLLTQGWLSYMSDVATFGNAHASAWKKADALLASTLTLGGAVLVPMWAALVPRAFDFSRVSIWVALVATSAGVGCKMAGSRAMHRGDIDIANRDRYVVCHTLWHLLVQCAAGGLILDPWNARHACDHPT